MLEFISETWQSASTFSGILSDFLSHESFGILSGISSDILSDIFSGIFFGIFSGILSSISSSSSMSSDNLFDILSVDFLANLLALF